MYILNELLKSNFRFTAQLSTGYRFPILYFLKNLNINKWVLGAYSSTLQSLNKKTSSRQGYKMWHCFVSCNFFLIGERPNLVQVHWPLPQECKLIPKQRGTGTVSGHLGHSPRSWEPPKKATPQPSQTAGYLAIATHLHAVLPVPTLSAAITNFSHLFCK